MNKSNKLECKEGKEKYEGRCRKICETDQQRNPETGRCNKSPKSKSPKNHHHLKIITT